MDDRPAVNGPPAVVALPAWIGVASASHVNDRLSAVLAAGATQIIADLSATVFLDAASAHRLVMIGHQTAARGGRLRLVIPPGALVRWVMVLAGVDHLLSVYSSIEEAGVTAASAGYGWLPWRRTS